MEVWGMTEMAVDHGVIAGPQISVPLPSMWLEGGCVSQRGLIGGLQDHCPSAFHLGSWGFSVGSWGLWVHGGFEGSLGGCVRSVITQMWVVSAPLLFWFMGALKVALGAVCSQIITQMWVVSAPPSILVHGGFGGGYATFRLFSFSCIFHYGHFV